MTNEERQLEEALRQLTKIKAAAWSLVQEVEALLESMKSCPDFEHMPPEEVRAELVKIGIDPDALADETKQRLAVIKRKLRE